MQAGSHTYIRCLHRCNVKRIAAIRGGPPARAGSGIPRKLASYEHARKCCRIRYLPEGEEKVIAHGSPPMFIRVGEPAAAHRCFVPPSLSWAGVQPRNGFVPSAEISQLRVVLRGGIGNSLEIGFVFGGQTAPSRGALWGRLGWIGFICKHFLAAVGL